MDKPKHPMSAYMLWLNSAREQIKSENPGLKITELALLGGQLWKSMDKTEWEEKAAKAKEQYAKDLESYIINGGDGDGDQGVKIENPKSPSSEADASISPSEAEALISPSEANASISPSEANVSISPSEADALISPSEANASVSSSEANASISPSEADALISPSEVNALISPSEVNASISPSEANASILTSEANASISPSEADALISPSEVNALISPSEVNASISPSEVNVSISQSETNASISPSEADALISPSEVNVSISLSEADASISPSEANASISPSKANASISPSEADALISPSKANASSARARDGESKEPPKNGLCADPGEPSCLSPPFLTDLEKGGYQFDTKKVKMTDIPKRPISAYMLWMNSVRGQILSENPGMSFAAITKKGSKLWMSMKDKTEWIEKAARAREQYAKHLKSCSTHGGGDDEAPHISYTRVTRPRNKDVNFTRFRTTRTSKQSGAGAEHGRFNEVSFVRNNVARRESSSNLDKPLPAAEEVSDCTLNNRNKSTDPESTVATTVNERGSKALRNKKAATMKNAGPPKKQSKIDSNCEESVSLLGNIVDPTVYKEDEYDRFALHIAAQLKKLPERSFILLQDQIQSVLTKERLKHVVCSFSSPGETTRACSYSHHGSLPSTPPASLQVTDQPTVTLTGQEDSNMGLTSQIITQEPTYEIYDSSSDCDITIISEQQLTGGDLYSVEHQQNTSDNPKTDQ